MNEHIASPRTTPAEYQRSEENTFPHHGMTVAEAISLTIINSGISMTGTISNILVIAAVLSNRQLRETGTATLLVSLSCFDLILCALYIPMLIFDINYGSSKTLTTVRGTFGQFVFIGSLNSAFCVSLDRFVSICYPYRYVEWMTGKLALQLIFITWFTAVAFSAIRVLSHPPIYLFFYIAILILLIISFHVAMCWVARREANQIARLYPPECQTLPIWNKSTVAVSMVIAASLVCWTPIVILPIFVSPSSPSFSHLIKDVLTFASLSSAINPFIFCWRLQGFRKALCLRLRKAKAVIHPN